VEGILEKESGFWRDLWRNSKTGIALFLGSLLFLTYSRVAIRYEIGQGWSGHPSVQNVLLDISRFIPVVGAAVAALILFIDIIVFVCGLLVDWRKKRFQEAVDEARAEAFEKGFAAGQQDKDSEDNEK
jgi:uncharacterized membrane protein